MDYNKLNSILSDCADVKLDKIKNETVKADNLPLIQLRNIFIENGVIHYEDLQNNIYVAVVKGGLGGRNPAWVAAYCGTDCVLLSVYAREGLINQHTSDSVIEKIRTEIIRITTNKEM